MKRLKKGQKVIVYDWLLNENIKAVIVNYICDGDYVVRFLNRGVEAFVKIDDIKKLID